MKRIELLFSRCDSKQWRSINLDRRRLPGSLEGVDPLLWRTFGKLMDYPGVVRVVIAGRGFYPRLRGFMAWVVNPPNFWVSAWS